MANDPDDIAEDELAAARELVSLILANLAEDEGDETAMRLWRTVHAHKFTTHLPVRLDGLSDVQNAHLEAQQRSAAEKIVSDFKAYLLPQRRGAVLVVELLVDELAAATNRTPIEVLHHVQGLLSGDNTRP